MPSPFSAGISVTSFETSLDPNEERLVRAIDWLTFYEATYTDAIVQTNAVMRVFLGTLLAR